MIFDPSAGEGTATPSRDAGMYDRLSFRNTIRIASGTSRIDLPKNIIKEEDESEDVYHRAD
jgi:hypothetical protein